jgi:hypothetical protein
MSKIDRVNDLLLVHLKFCWCILNFAGADFEAKRAPAKDWHQHNLLVHAPKNNDTIWLATGFTW